MSPCAMVFLVLALLTSFSSAETLEAYVTAEAATTRSLEQTLQGVIAEAGSGTESGEAGTVTHPKRKKLLFIHIPKNAGTTIEELGLEAGMKWGKHNVEYKDKSFTGENEMVSLLGSESGEHVCSFWHVPPKRFPDPNPYKDPNSEFFCVVRDPWDRLASEFMWRWSMKSDTPDEDIASCDPASFATWLNISLQAVESGDDTLNNCHMLPQYEYIRDSSGKSWCQHVLKLDKLTQEFNKLMRKKKLPIRMDDSDKYNEEDDKDDECSKIKEAPLTKLFPVHLQKRVRKIYAEDFAHLGDSMIRRQKTSRSVRRESHRKHRTKK